MTERENINSAIGSWSGFIYQGLCGLLVALRMIRDEPDRYKEYSLQLDGFEDFSIFDENGKIFSLHQCKCVKGKTNYDDEFNKISDKIETNKGMLQDPDHPQYYFHCSCSVVIDSKYAITAYPFETDKYFCEPGDIQRLLSQEIQALKNRDSNTEAVRAALEAIVNTEVLNTQQKYFDARPNERLWKISRNQNIPFSDLKNILASFLPCYAPGDFLLQMKTAYIIQMDERAEEEGDADNRKRIDAFINQLNCLNQDEMRRFIQRINPKERIIDTHDCWRVIASKERINYLYNLITEFPLNYESLNWKTTNSTQTPSTLGNDESATRICKQIYGNQANLDLPWLYDWIIGHVDEHVEDIEKTAHVITNTQETGTYDKNIFHTKKVGILTKKEKLDGKFD